MLSPEVHKAFIVFKNKLIRAWILDTEDGCLDRSRRATIIAHAEADEAERLFRALLEPNTIVNQKVD